MNVRYLVTVEAETVEQANQVINERLAPDEDYGFEYTVEWELTPWTA